MLMFNQIGDYEKGKSSNAKDSQLVQFNLDFERYTDDKGIKGTDIISLINKVIDYNERAANGGNNNDINYNIKMSIKISGFKKFNEKYAYHEEKYKLFSEDEYTFGAEDRNNKIKDILDNCSFAEAEIGINNLKILAGYYNPGATEKENEDKIKEILKEMNSGRYNSWNKNQTPTLDTIRRYKQYSEFKTSTFKVSQNPDYKQGQIQNLYFEFSK